MTAAELIDLAPVLELLALGAALAVLPLTEPEQEIVGDLMATRHLITALISEWRALRYPENRAYIMRHNPAAWQALAARSYPMIRGPISLVIVGAIMLVGTMLVTLGPRAFEGYLPDSVMAALEGGTISTLGGPVGGDTAADFLDDDQDGLQARGPIAAMRSPVSSFWWSTSSVASSWAWPAMA